MCGGGREKNKRILLGPETSSAMPPSITVPPDSSKVASDHQQEQQAEEGPELQPQVEQEEPVGYKVIPAADLSDDKDLQKAIALSIQEQQQHQHYSKPGGDSGAEAVADDTAMIVSAEDREVSRALEESLRELPSIVVKKKTNPAERKRDPGVPVGLVNIGNSCWFNVVSQPLFHLPGFRDMILNYKHVSPSVTSTPNSKEKVSTPKVSLALSKLFALMLVSEQKYVAPTECVCLFQGGEAETRRNEQEDVCEFIHKLLERLELEFNEVLREEGQEKESSGTTKDVQFTNPIMKFFYGQFKKENINSHNDEEYGTKQETFGQYPLHVLKYGDIHDSILASMSGRMPDRQKKKEVQAETTKSEEGYRSDGEVQQESWFKILPPVLIFSLSRYEFSQATQRAEKVHNKFEFPELLYMDRYMETNKQLVRQKHVQVAAIKKQLAQLNYTLKQYQQFGNGVNKYPLKDILGYSLQFAETGAVTEVTRTISKPEDADTSKPDGKIEADMGEAPGATNDQVSASSSSSVKVLLPSPSDMLTECQDGRTLPDEGMEVDSTEDSGKEMKDSLTVTYGVPQASAISTDDLNLLRRCLSQWENDVRSTETELCGHISVLESQLKHMYSEPELLKTAYQLHAVVVHEGQASAGHYWVYIRDNQCGWRKYNDVQVSKSSWEELQQDSLGGQNNASAYCLMYTDTERHSLLYPTVSDVNDNLHDLLQTLPIHLQEYVKQDNLNFLEEINKWENRSVQSVQSVAVLEPQQSPHSSRSSQNTGLPPPTAPNSPIGATEHEDSDVNFYINVDTIMVAMIGSLLRKEVHQYAEHLAKPEDVSPASEPLNKPTSSDTITMRIVKGATDQIATASKSCKSPLPNLPSLVDFGVFLLHSSANHGEKILHLHACLVLRQLALAATVVSPVVESVICSCTRFIRELRSKTEVCRAYKVWQAKYKLLLDTVWHLVCGWKALDSENFQQALPLFLKSYHIHKDLILLKTKDEVDFISKSQLRVVSEEILIECRCKCLLGLNIQLIKMFLKSSDLGQAKEVVYIVSWLLVPALGELHSDGKECEAGATVRNQWCELLEKQLPPHCSQLIQQVLEAVLSAECAPSHSGEGAASGGGRYKALPVSLKPMPSVTQLYSEYKQLLFKMGVSTTSL